MDYLFSDAEKQCLKHIVSLFAKGHTRWHNQLGFEQAGLPTTGYGPILETLQHAGVIENLNYIESMKVFYFEITPLAVQLSRKAEAEANKPVDYSKSYSEKIDRNRYLAIVKIVAKTIGGIGVVSGFFYGLYKFFFG